jgi:hypothetical protein
VLIAVDFDGCCVEQTDTYDATTALRLKPGAYEALWALKQAGHRLILWSGRSSWALRKGPEFNLALRAGIQGEGHRSWYESTALNEARYQQMLAFVKANLPGVFDVIDDGSLGGKPPADLSIDDRCVRIGFGLSGVSWQEVADAYGQPGFPLAVEGMPYSVVARRFRALAKTHGCRVTEIGQSDVGPILCVEQHGVREVVIVSGQHGDEPAGPLALYDAADGLFSHARALGVGLRLYPCANPEGFQARKRRDDQGATRSNTAIEYRVGDKWVGELPADAPEPAEYRPARGTAPETKVLVAALNAGPVPWAFLDLHQDSAVPVGKMYGYCFGSRAPYAAVMRECQEAEPWEGGKLKNEAWSKVALTTDADGLVNLRDGSPVDWMWRRGAQMSICVEAPTEPTAPAMACEAEWAHRMIEAAANGATAR